MKAVAQKDGKAAGLIVSHHAIGFKRGGLGAVRAGCAGGEERLEHMEVCHVHLADDDGGRIDSCCSQSSAEEGTGRYGFERCQIHLAVLVRSAQRNLFRGYCS